LNMVSAILQPSGATALGQRTNDSTHTNAMD
jgi:hypothetical protein